MSYFKSFNQFIANIPSPLAGLALAIASLGLCWDSVANLNGSVQIMAALVASCIILPLLLKFLFNPSLLKQELKHPVASSLIPTLPMAMMVVANAIALFSLQIGQIICWLALILHFFFLASFIFYRSKSFNFKQILPSWFIPPIGLVLAVVTHPGGLPPLFAKQLLLLGLISYAMLLPIILYRLLFSGPLDNNQKPILIILATPASLLLVGYLAITAQPTPLLFGVLLILAILMTLYAYIAFFKLLRLPFMLSYSAFTFPLVVGAIALFKTSHFLLKEGVSAQWIEAIKVLANIELIIASGMVIYVAFRFIQKFHIKAN